MNIRKNITNIARSVLINEADAIRQVADFLDGNFVECVAEIINLKGRVVITGIGKSALIANKIVATLNSTGTASIFMHGADAIHGDLGMVRKDDMVICISKSGNTPEIKVLVPLIRFTGAKLVALVSDINSYLAKSSDYVLNATVDSEAYSNVLAPTTSTSVHLALGDALAVAIMEAKGFTSQDFAQYHPGGTLGKRMYLKVRDIMVSENLPIVAEKALVSDVIVEVSSKRLGSAAILNKDRKLAGIFTDGDLRRLLEKTTDISKVRVKDIMNTNPKTIHPEEFAVKALHFLEEKQILQLIVIEEEKIVGFIHLHDILKEGIV